MRAPLRIAILEADRPLDGTAARYGSYGGVFSSFLQAGAEELGTPGLSEEEGLEITKWDIHQSEIYPLLDDIDAILITGSRMSSLIPWEVACL